MRRAAVLPSFIHLSSRPRLALTSPRAYAVHLLLGLLLEEARAVLGRLAIEALLVARRRPRRRRCLVADFVARGFAAGSRATLGLSTDGHGIIGSTRQGRASAAAGFVPSRLVGALSVVICSARQARSVYWWKRRLDSWQATAVAHRFYNSSLFRCW